jgi:hypothetical protein
VDIVHNMESNMLNLNNGILPSSVVVCTDDNLSCDLQGEAVVLNIQSGIYFGLNALGARIWELIQKPARVSFIRDELIKEFDVHDDHCEADLLSFLKKLQVNALLRVQETEPQ